VNFECLIFGDELFIIFPFFLTFLPRTYTDGLLCVVFCDLGVGLAFSLSAFSLVPASPFSFELFFSSVCVSVCLWPIFRLTPTSHFLTLASSYPFAFHL